MDLQPFLLYGATGYTGRLIANAAAQQRLPAVLAGRDRRALAVMGEELGLPWRACALDDPATLDAALRETGLVLHCAGPFLRTFRPMVEACLRTRTHYLDITGDMIEYGELAQLDGAARRSGIALLPSVGFDVVPSDCLAAHLRQRMPAASELNLAIYSPGGMSRGTLLTSAETVGRPGMIRRGGELVPVPAAWRTRAIDFGDPITLQAGAKPRLAVTMPWGDVFTAYHTTGIPDITVYMALPAMARLTLRSVRWLGGILSTRPAQALLRRALMSGAAGPSDQARAKGYALLWGEAIEASGRRVVTRMRTPHSYTLTALTALAVVGRVLSGQVRTGFQTPAGAYGPDLVMEIDGAVRADEPETGDEKR